MLTETLASLAGEFRGLEIIHLTPIQEESPLARPELIGSFRNNTFYIGRGLRAAVAAGKATSARPTSILSSTASRF